MFENVKCGIKESVKSIHIYFVKVRVNSPFTDIITPLVCTLTDIISPLEYTLTEMISVNVYTNKI